MPAHEPISQTATHRIATISDAWLRIFEPQPDFQHRGRTYAVRRSGKRALQLLTDIALRQPHQPLLSFRPRIRQLIQSTPPVLLSYVLSHTSDMTVLRLTIWVLGKSKQRYALPDLFELRNYPNAKLRREVVRALQRFSAWHELRKIEADCAFDDTRRQASAYQPQPFDQRLAGFVAIAHQHRIKSTRHRLIVTPGADISHGRQPKSKTEIRRVLRNIRHLIARARRRRRVCWRLR